VAEGHIREVVVVLSCIISQALVRAGLVHQERAGRVLTTRADYAAMNGLVDFLTDKCCDGLHVKDLAS